MKLVKWSQNSLRKWHRDVSVVLLRDVDRANRFFECFYNQLEKDYDTYNLTENEAVELHRLRIDNRQKYNCENVFTPDQIRYKWIV